jgi:hypothetical protein
VFSPAEAFEAAPFLRSLADQDAFETLTLPDD